MSRDTGYRHASRGYCNSSHIAALELSIDGAVLPLARWPDASENTPVDSETGTQMHVFGSPDLSPNVSGLYTMTGTANGASVFTRSGLVGGRQYNLHRWTWTTPTPLTAWFVSTTAAPGYPSASDPFWWVFTRDLGTIVCRYSADSGAVYSGRDWGARGNIIRHNYFHAITSLLSNDVHAVYLDDCLSGILVEGNIIDGVSGFGIEHGGGRDDIMVNNVFAHCGGAALHTDARCVTWRSNAPPVPDHTAGSSWDLLGKLEGNHYQQDPWRTRYPMCAAIPDDWASITAAGSPWLLPRGSQFTRNVGTSNSAWLDAGDMYAVPAFADMSNNIADAGTVFVNEAAGDLNVAPASAAFTIPGFQVIPFATIGIQP